MDPQEIAIPVNSAQITGDLTFVPNSKSLVIFAHGSGSSRKSTRNKFVADIFQKAQISTLLFDLLTPEEDIIDQETREFRFNIPLLAKRLVAVTEWLEQNQRTKTMSKGYFGASTGAAAALIAAAELPDQVAAVVSRGGRVDLAEKILHLVKCPTLFIVGGLDYEVMELNQIAYDKLTCTKNLAIVENATHLFEEHGTLEQAANIARAWFVKYL